MRRAPRGWRRGIVGGERSERVFESDDDALPGELFLRYSATHPDDLYDVIAWLESGSMIDAREATFDPQRGEVTIPFLWLARFGAPPVASEPTGRVVDEWVTSAGHTVTGYRVPLFDARLVVRRVRDLSFFDQEQHPPVRLAWEDRDTGMRMSVLPARDHPLEDGTTRIQLGGIAIDVDAVDVVGEVRLSVRGHADVTESIRPDGGWGSTSFTNYTVFDS